MQEAAVELGLVGLPDDSWEAVVGAVKERFAGSRRALPLSSLIEQTGAAYPAPESLSGEALLEVCARLIEKAKRIVVLVGAGISVSCGIPDFRSPGTGFYDVVRAAQVDGLNDPQEM
jgi:hypothetical protein